MDKLTRSDILPLERYAEERSAFRARVIAHKKARNVSLGSHVSLLFEDRLTVQHQVQEMLRIERIFEAAAIQEEIDAYNPLVPDGSNLKATMLLEFPDPDVRTRRLSQLGGIEHRVYSQVDGGSRLFAHADEDSGRSVAEKTSAVHFLRFEFAASDLSALRNGAGLSFGIDDPRLPERTQVSAASRTALLSDFTA